MMFHKTFAVMFHKTFAVMLHKTIAVMFHKTFAVVFHKTFAVILVGHRRYLTSEMQRCGDYEYLHFIEFFRHCRKVNWQSICLELISKIS